MSSQDLPYLHALRLVPNLGAQKMRLLLAFFGSGQKAWKASHAELLQAGLGPNLTEKLLQARQNFDVVRAWQTLSAENIKILTAADPHFPKFLKEIPHCPFLIYTKGNVELLNAPSLAVVGSRAFTNYGKQAAYAFAEELARANIVVVSGLALGIDSAAHRGALDAQGATIAVLGNSLDCASIYPRHNVSLAQEIIAKGGLLVSEYPPVMPANKGTFPARNRLMAGLTSGTLVVEAAMQSGSLITANLALEFNRNVYAVPGSIFASQNEGTNQLIKNGAKPVTNIKDILEDFALTQNLTQKSADASLENRTPTEQKVLKILSAEPVHIDIIVKLSKLKTAEVISTLSFLELQGAVKNMGGQYYIKT